MPLRNDIRRLPPLALDGAPGLLPPKQDERGVSQTTVDINSASVSVCSSLRSVAGNVCLPGPPCTESLIERGQDRQLWPVHLAEKSGPSPRGSYNRSSVMGTSASPARIRMRRHRSMPSRRPGRHMDDNHAIPPGAEYSSRNAPVQPYEQAGLSAPRLGQMLESRPRAGVVRW